MKKAIVILSGGVDSTTLLYSMQEYECRALTFNYGQRHAKEIAAAEDVVRKLNSTSMARVEHEIVYMPDVAKLMGGSSQTDIAVDVPEGHYSADTMAKTIVPNRNMIMLSIAAAWAVSTRSSVVAFGAHHGDHAIYPDCRAPFVNALNRALLLGNEYGNQPEVIAPFIYLSKANIVSIGKSLGVPFHLTWSCYKGGEQHCGKCGTCVERREAFEIANVYDPVPYDVPMEETARLITNTATD